MMLSMQEKASNSQGAILLHSPEKKKKSSRVKGWKLNKRYMSTRIFHS